MGFFCLMSSIGCFAQEGDEGRLTLPDNVMREVVGRILRYQFKPRQKPATIPLSDSQIKRDWLPKIGNITFELIPDERIAEYEKGVFLFEEIEREGVTYSINVGWGDLDCSATGDTWKFRVSGEKVRLWPTKRHWGRGCGSSGSNPPLIPGLQLGQISPNEISGYEFFGKGKLRDISIGISTRDDMTKMFGGDCQNTCQYDENWSLQAEYISKGLAWTTISGEDKTEYFAKDEFVGKLGSLSLRPTGIVSFNSMAFPDRVFARGISMSIGDAWGADGFEGAVHTSYYIYNDGYGLRYVIYGEETFNNLKNKPDKENKFSKGELVEIKYAIPASLKNDIYYGLPVKNNE